MIENLTSLYIESLENLAVDIVIALAILFLFWCLFHYSKGFLVRFLDASGMDDYLSQVIVYSVFKTILIIIAAITALSQLGINILAAMTGFGILGFAIGFAAKDTLGNIIAGFMIFWDKPFRVGDWIEVDEHLGQVQAITMRTTRILTTMNVHIVLPNQVIINSTIINHDSKRNKKTITHFLLPYDSDLELAKQVLLQAVSKLENVLQDPPPSFFVSSIEQGLVTCGISAWGENVRKAMGLPSAIREVGRLALLQAGFTAPYPITLSDTPTVGNKVTVPKISKSKK